MEALLQQGLELFHSIPATFWGVVAGAVLSLGGVTLTNQANDRRLRLQFEHDRALRAKERDLALRKEVYLAGAEAFQAGSLMISNMPNLDISQEKLEAAYQEKAPAIAKVQIIAGDRAMKAVATAMVLLGELVLQLLSKRIILLALKQEIAQIEKLVGEFSKTRDEMLELMTQHNIDGSKDQQRFATLQNNFEFEQKRIDDGFVKRNKMIFELTDKQFLFAEECLSASQRLGTTMTEVLIAVRDELELPFDAKAYAVLVLGLQQQQTQHMAEFLSNLRGVIATDLANQVAQDSSRVT